MPNRTDVLIETRSFSITPGEIAETTVTVRNMWDSVRQFTFCLQGIDPDWYDLPVSSTTLFPNDQEELRITFHPPRTGKVKPGLYTCHLVIDCRENPENSEDVEITLEIKDIPEVTLEITPELVSGRKGTYKIIVHNPGQNAATVNLQITDHDALLHCNLLPMSLSVPGGGSAESILEVKLGWLHFFRSQREYNFTVIAGQADSDQVKTVKGRLCKISRKIRLPFQVSLPAGVSWHRQPPCINRFEAITEDNRRYSLAWDIEYAREVRLDDEKTDLHGDLRVHPAETTSYTLVASNKRESVSQTITVEPIPVPKEKYSDRILIFMTPDILQVSAGGESVEATIEIQNTGTIVDKFSLEIEGIAQSWYSFSASSVSLMPHGKEQVQVTFHPPKVKGVESDNYPFAVILQSQSIPEDSAITVGQLEILPSVNYSIAIKPYRMRCRRRCTFQVQVTSKDVSDANVFIDVNDIESGLIFQIENDSPVVPPWQTIDIPMLVRPKRNSIVGDIKRYDISITASTVEGYTQLARCQMDHKPLLRSWRPIVRTLKYIIIIGIAGFAIYYVIRLGGGWGSLVRDPQGWLEGTIRHIRGWFY